MGRLSPLRGATRKLSGLALLTLSLVVAGACGGGATAGSKSATPDRGDDHDQATSGADDTSEGPAPSPCNDPGCFACGGGLCPSGFYCDEDVAGGPACSWSPACAQEPDCACLTRELGGACRCEARDGGVYVSCG